MGRHTEHPRERSSSVARVRRWEDASAWPLFVLSIAFFALSVWLLADDGLRGVARAFASLAIVVLWIVFIADFLLRLGMSRRKGAFLRARWYEAVSLAIPFVRPFLIIAFVWRLPVFRRSPGLLRTRFMISVSLFALLFVYTASTAVWFVERQHPRANIVDLGDAIWWGFTTITTVGYGDFVPVTPEGRFFAVLLMIGGIVVLGVTSATLVSTLTDQIRQAGQRQRALMDPDGEDPAVVGASHPQPQPRLRPSSPPEESP